jgi:hypothetical protein
MPLTIALLSDIHAHILAPDDAKAPSYLATSLPTTDHVRNPVAGLRKLISDADLTANVLICGGDLGDKANPNAQMFVWDQLRTLKGDLHAKAVISAAGNHDLDSRYKYNDHDAKGTLQALDPMFPGLEVAQCDRFWSRNFVVVDHEQWRLLVLNSAAYHGAGKTPEKEFQHGRVSQRTITAITRELKERPLKALNVLLCHHHLIKNDEIALEDYSQMAGGDLLLNVLGTGEFGNWIVLHGHKHYPRIWYAPGGSTAPTIFSAGSFSAKLYPELGTRVRNQFYVLNFPLESYASLKMGACGTANAWDWIVGLGWQRARTESGIPFRAGFGCRVHPESLTHDVAAALAASGEPYKTWDEMAALAPALNYLTPHDLNVAIRALRDHHAINVSRDDQGLPSHFWKIGGHE